MNAVWLIGFRAAGKTTLGRHFASELGWSFLDLDEELEARMGCTILDFVAREGAPAFRKRETELLREISGRSPAAGLVIATGGGFVDEPESFQVLAASPWPKLWLDPPAATLWERLGGAPDRRKIGNLTDFPAMLALLEKRRPFYEKIATSRIKSQDISECLASLKMVMRKL